MIKPDVAKLSKKVGFDIIVKTIGAKHNTKIPVIKYLEMCTEVTWYMQIQDPPAVLLFVRGDNDAMTYFRPYTSSGSKLEYIVWPAMLLHENGPMVSKGVAQFSKQAEKNTYNKNDLGCV